MQAGQSKPDDGPTLQDVLSNRMFLRLVMARALSGFALMMISVAVGWQLYVTTGSALDLGLLGLAQFAPLLILTPLIGYVVDAFDRRHIALACQFAVGALALVLAAATMFVQPGRTMLIALMTAIGAIRAFEFPAINSLLPLTVERAAMTRATAAYSGFNQLAVIGGPVAAGLIYAVSPPAVYLLAALFLALAMVAVVTLRTQVPQAFEKRRISLDLIMGGAAFLKTNRLVTGTILLDLAAVLLGACTALMPVFARDVLNVGPQGLGVLRAAPAVGAIVTLAILARWPLRHNVGRIMLLSVGAFGVATVIFGLSRSLWLSLIALVVLGATDIVAVVVRQSLVQLETPDEMRGRVGAINSLCISSSNLLGEFRAGAAAALAGAGPAVVLGGVCAILVAGFWSRLFPEIVRLDRIDATAPNQR